MHKTFTTSLVFMGVAGCGKSTLAAAVAAQLGCVLVEGDDFHSAQNREKMAQGIALTDDDRAGWLALLAAQLQQHPGGLVLTCSALKKAYRECLRQGNPGLRFVFLELQPAEALKRVTARAATHFFSSALVDSQFATLESPVGEPGVLHLDASASMHSLQTQVGDWLRSGA
jgi:gluconokinase